MDPTRLQAFPPGCRGGHLLVGHGVIICGGQIQYSDGTPLRHLVTITWTSSAMSRMALLSACPQPVIGPLLVVPLLVPGLAWTRDRLWNLHFYSAALSALRSSRHCTLVASCVFLSTNSLLTAVRLGSPSSALSSPMWIGGNSGGGCFILPVCLPLF